ncbi:MAG TPA: 4-hydroxy-tetrahydrodipicolinate synthase [Steroidobacteraceae bacterium]|jgi:4-hydroxy-tetrahydrodipicolinate synthase|nr:4-hydroxy-tetrahydrodipicolinate synthase [Steroidobacteraceae bacterium]HEV3182823.1 4-hydroxy-tetrahydrodipicolinate synthase [Steroidobacteraceae bacterium]
MFSGSLVAIVTPMQPDGAVDFTAWAQLLEFHVAHGTQGIVVGGTTGESATLRDAELRELIARACEQLRGRLVVIAGAGTSSTAATVERVRWISQLPIDALLIVTPAYNRPPQEGLYLHFAAAAAAASKPILLYNVPARTAVDMKPATVARLAHVARIAGVKEAVPEAARVRELVESCPRDFVVLSGDDASARATLAAGARGVISVTANVAPRAMSDMVAAASRADAARAAQLDAPLSALHRELFVEANPIPVKWLLMQMGLIGPGIRLPLTPLASQYHDSLRAAARAAGILS